MKISHILGLNSRAQLFSYEANSYKGRKVAASKILTSRSLKRIDVPTPKIYKKFFKPQDIMTFDWTSLPESFALKPSKGLGGDGIIVVKKRKKLVNSQAPAWITTQRDVVTADDLKLHILDILEGAYSIGNVPDSAFIQEYVGRHKAFIKYAYRGTPDIRVIVFNYVPVMAMLRLPTPESGGRANLHQGAIGVGIDIATGITTRAIWHGSPVKVKPGSTLKLTGIKIPEWKKILLTAATCRDIPGLGYMGVDIVLHPSRGPMVLEVNSQPGLQIQLANMAGLKKRLERVDELEVNSAEQGVKIAQALFSERFLDRLKANEGVKTIKAAETISILNKEGKRVKTVAKVDTGAWSSSIDAKLARKLGIYAKKNVLWYLTKRSSLGEEERPVVAATVWLAGRKIKTVMSISDRSKMVYKVIIGRTDLQGFLVDPIIDAEQKKQAQKW